MGDEKRRDIKKPLKGVSGAEGFGLNFPICGKKRELPGKFWGYFKMRGYKKRAVVMPPLSYFMLPVNLKVTRDE